MKLFTHNLLSSRFMKNVKIGYPLELCVLKSEISETDYNEEFLQKMMPKIDYNVLKEAASICGQILPESLDNVDEEGLKQIHKALFDIDIITGSLTCPESGKKFPISDGIPNMLCNEDE